jgi:DNA-binding phage protein
MGSSLHKRRISKSNDVATETAREMKATLATALQGLMNASSLSVTAVAEVVGCNRRIIQRLLNPTDLGITLHTLTRVTTALNLEPKLVVLQRPVAELNPLVARLAAAPNKASGDALRQQILEGFYGHSVDLAKLGDAATKKPAIRVTRLAHAQA